MELSIMLEVNLNRKIIKYLQKNFFLCPARVNSEKCKKNVI